MKTDKAFLRLLGLLLLVLQLQIAAAFLPKPLGLRQGQQGQQEPPSSTSSFRIASSASPLEIAAATPGPMLSINGGDGNVMNLQQLKQESSSLTKKLSRFQSRLVRAGMILYVASMCVALPLTLIPQKLLYKLGLVTKKRKEVMAVSTGQFCSRCLLRLIPFCNIQIFPCTTGKGNSSADPEPAIWVCNHVSMLDVFILMGVDRQLRGGHKKRPIKVVYWKGLETNPVTKLLFKQAGFIPVQMADNGSGNDNEYDVKSFKKMLKDVKEAFKDGFDIGVLPEGQLNPSPEQGLLPVFPGAFTLSKLSRRPVHMMALYGTHHLWHATKGMTCEERVVKVRAYPIGRRYKTARDFMDTFSTVVGNFGAKGEDLPEEELNAWLTGSIHDDNKNKKDKSNTVDVESSSSSSEETKT